MMMSVRRLGALACMGILLSAALAYPTSYAESEILLSLGKRLYTAGESAVIVGLVESPSNIPVIVQVWNPRNEACSFQELDVNDDRTFNAEPILLSGSICGAPGTYTVKAFYGEFEGSATFEVRSPSAAVAATSADVDRRVKVLLDILERAKQSVEDKIAEVEGKEITIPDDIMRTYEQGLSELELTEDAVGANDLDSATEHMKNALKSFRTVFIGLISLKQEEVTVEAVQAQLEEEQRQVTSPEAEDLDSSEEARLQQAIERTTAFMNKLKSKAASNNIVIPLGSLADFENALSDARGFVEAGDTGAAAKSLAEAKQILADIHKSLIQEVKNRKQDMAMEFVTKTVDRIDRMITEAKSMGLSEEVIEALEEAKHKLSDAASMSDVRKISHEIKGKLHDLVTHKSKNFEKVLEHMQSKLAESKARAEKLGLALGVYDRIESMMDDAIASWESGDNTAAVDILERSARMLGQFTSHLDSIKKGFQHLERLEAKAEQLMAEYEEEPQKVSAIEKAMRLIDSAEQTLHNAVSKKDLRIARSMAQQAEDILARVSGGEAGTVHKGGPNGGAVEPKKMHPEPLMKEIRSLEAAAKKLMSQAGDNEEAVDEIEAALEDIREAKKLVRNGEVDEAKEKVSDAKKHLRNAKQIIDESIQGQ